MSCDHEWVDISTLTRSEEICWRCRTKRAKGRFDHEPLPPPPRLDDFDERKRVVFWLFLLAVLLAGFVGFAIGRSVGISC